MRVQKEFVTLCVVCTRHAMSASTIIPFEEHTILPQENVLSIETGGEQISDDVINDSETQVGMGSSLPSPPTPPRPRPEYQACNIITDDVEGVDTELYYSDVEPEDEDEGSHDTSTSGEYPVNDLRDKINLTSIPSSNTKSGGWG